MEIIVLDASVVVPLMIQHPLAPKAEALIRHWKREYYRLVSPCFMPVEVVSALRQVVYNGKFDPQQALEAVEIMMGLEIELVAPSAELLQSSLCWAERLGQSKAYDAQYVALAEQLHAEFWSADEKLVNALKALGVDWAHGIGG
ncbi:MAG: type II toxin-antitoxin system VapC family toxin [Anaerolineae bacterium]|nr:type II toxin-antitoxin system VapC family toxin [Anaerolineae bacterium]